MYRSFFKPALDFLAAFLVLLIFSPLWLALGLVLAVANGGQAFFVQTRPGKGERLFRLIKFKTMNDACDDKGRLLPDAQRLTAVGRFIRATSLDEVPQLLNVLKGEMSIVGPRPLLVRYLARYDEEQRRRHDVKPGITGWAQVNGRNAIGWEEKFRLDVWYVEHCSFALDMRILWMTVLKVLKSEGIRQPGQATMEEFLGSRKAEGRSLPGRRMKSTEER
ncbi:MAG: sugar transferase [Phaeodactylibacter sp.]|nr:sugar transferase [Phaeodactylibacter sp.]MCB9294292.1 sugar transferase [Lewinellaceae bacterium]